MMTRNFNPDCHNAATSAPADLMVREADHRIANSLQALLCPVRSDGGARPLEGARELQARVAAIATVHRLLSASGDLTTVDTEEFFNPLVAALQMTWRGQNGVENILLSQPRMRISGDAALSLGVVINELVTNACKYAYRDGGRRGDVRIGFSANNGKFLLLVSDDGAGRPIGAARSGGFGRRLIEFVASRFDGTVEYQPGHPGTIAVFTGCAELLLPRQLPIANQ